MFKLTVKTPERRSDAVLVFLLLTLSIFHIFSSASIVKLLNCEHVIAGRDHY